LDFFALNSVLYVLDIENLKVETATYKVFCCCSSVNDINSNGWKKKIMERKLT